MDDRIHVPLELDGFEVTATEVIDNELVVSVRSQRRLACVHCGSLDVVGHGRCLRRIRDTGVGRPTTLVWSQRRIRCRDCRRTSRERSPHLAGRRGITCRFHHRLFLRAINEPFAHVAASEGVSAYRVVEAFDAHAAPALRTTLSPAPVISLDESAFLKRFKFHTAVSDPEAHDLIEIFYGRDQATVTNALAAMPVDLRKRVETVVIDLWWPYRRAAAAVLPHARIVVDKFHVVAAIDGAAQKIRRNTGRRTTQQRLTRSGRPAPRQVIAANDPAIFNVRWVFLKRAATLSDQERRWLESVFDEAPPQLRAAWWLKEAFAAIYDAPDRVEAERRLDVWIDNMHASGLKEFYETWRSLRYWRDQILNYFDDPMTNGFAEGITNKIKVIKRTAYGFRSKERYRRKVLLAFGHRRTGGQPPLSA